MAGREWSIEEIDYIKDNFGKIKTQDIAIHLNRSMKSVWHKYEQLHLEKELPKIGEKRNRLTVISDPFYQNYGKQQKAFTNFKCECGKEITGLVTTWKNNVLKSCGCLRDETSRIHCIKRNTTHGGSYSRLFRIWCAMRARCKYVTSKSYKNYGARGITICDEWGKFESFKEWSLLNGYEDNLTIDRKNPNDNYCPSNCRWSNRITQANNKRNNKFITAWGETKTLSDWMRDKRCLASYTCVPYRLSVGWPPEKALSTPPLSENRYLGVKAVLD